MAQQYATAAGVGTGPEMPWMIDLSDIPVKAGPTYPQLFADGGRVNRFNGSNESYMGKTLPEVVVNGYKPISLDVFYPFTSIFPTSGHSALSSPYMGNKYLNVDKMSDTKGYNLFTNNCADATLDYLNYVFGTNESPHFFVTPGDVRDYAVDRLGGTLIEGAPGSGYDRVLIPVTSENVDQIKQRTQVFYDDYYNKHDMKNDHTYQISNGPLGYRKRFVSKDGRRFTLNTPTLEDIPNIVVPRIPIPVFNGFNSAVVDASGPLFK